VLCLLLLCCAVLAVYQVVGRDVLFRGLRVRMSIATGGIDAVRLHSVTQRAEYVGEVLRKVQAVGETPQGGQVRVVCLLSDCLCHLLTCLKVLMRAAVVLGGISCAVD
jgi:hypothetical protein